MEIWKPLVGFEGCYEISNYGVVRSLDRYVNTFRGSRLVKGRILKGGGESNKYLNVYLATPDKKGQTYEIHRLVGKTFVPNPSNNPVINHKDGNKHNNNADNLEWVTQKENIIHSWELGKAHNQGKLNRKKIMCVETGEIFDSRDCAAKAHGPEHLNYRSSAYNIGRCAKNGKKAYGFTWKYL